MFSLNPATLQLPAGMLVDASFRGVSFDCLRSVDSAEREQAQHALPYRDGAQVEDHGRKARRVALTLFFWGKDYQQRVRRLVAALDQPGPGELIHPVFGSMPLAQVLDYRISHDADAPDSCSVEVNWIEASPGQPFFAQRHPQQQCEALHALVNKVRSSAGELFVQALPPLSGTGSSLARLAALRRQLTQAQQQLTQLAQQGIAQAQDFLAYPQAFVSQVSTLIDTIAGSQLSLTAEPWPGHRVGVTLRPSAGLLHKWSAMHNRLQTVQQRLQTAGELLQQADAALAGGKSDTPRIDALLQTNVATALAAAAAGVFRQHDQQAPLPPAAIEQITADVRRSLQTAIQTWRTALPGDASRQLIDELRTLGLQLQQTAATLIAERPPLVTRELSAPTTLRQLAHQWYGDSKRATELLRLNPQLRNPNQLHKGDRIHGYAT